VSDIDVTALAASLAETAAHLDEHIQQRARQIAGPLIRAAVEDAQAAQAEQVRQQAAFDRRLDDCRNELLRQLAARDMSIGRMEADAVEVKKAIRAVEALHVWTNEDGKQFVFADDLWAALADVSYVAHIATSGTKEN